MRHCPLRALLAAGLVLLALASVSSPASLLFQGVSESQPTPPSTTNESQHQVVNVIVVGATGDLAAKYLWVALFRLALEAAATSGRSFRFFAGASDSQERGRVWHDKFFDHVFAQRVCGAVDGDEGQLSTAQRDCLTFLEGEFKPNVQYTPLRTETNYKSLGEKLTTMDERLPAESEEGRMVYLAIPPQFFLQSCGFVHRYLRPQPSETGLTPFLRVVVEKPFGRDLQSAHELAEHLRAIYSNDELYVMDHYAGKPVVRALRSYFQLNAAALHPIWNSQHVHDIHIEMTETATLQNRVHYFDSAGIIRDVMVNHLQLLLSVAVAPSFNPEIFTSPATSREFAQRVHSAQLAFIESLQAPPESFEKSLFVAQYEKYATHYRQEMHERLDQSDHFTPTAARIQLISSQDGWTNATFLLAAAKAAAARQLTITVTFRDGVFPRKEACTFTVTIQKALNADTHRSHRMEWSCDVEEILADLQLPSGWEYLDPKDHRVVTPTQGRPDLSRRDQGAASWELGDEPSAYDTLLREVARGATEHFADLDEVEAAWGLWTPVVNAAEALTDQGSGQSENVDVQPQQDAPLQHAVYPAGTSPWEQLQSNSQAREKSPIARDEL